MNTLLILLATFFFIMFIGAYITYALKWENKLIPFLQMLITGRPDYNINTHGDFKRYFDTKYRRNYWVLGYYGGGSVNISDVNKLAKQFAMKVGVPVSSVKIDEVLYSRRYKYFKFLYSDVLGQKPEPNTRQMGDVMRWLHD